MSNHFSGLESEPGAAPGPAGRYLNRELSWLDFSARVLALAEDAALPLLERAKFAAIVGENLDQFFQVRVAGLRAQLEAGDARTSVDGLTPSEQLGAIRTRVLRNVARQDELLQKEILPALARAGIEVLGWADLSPAERALVTDVFQQRIFPVLTPLSVDPAHPFPYISNLSLNIGTIVRDPAKGAVRFARVKVPPLLPRFLPIGDGHRMLRLEEAIAAHLESLFPGMEIVERFCFRVTRDAELAIEEEEADDLLIAVESGLRRRLRTNDVVRLELPDGVTTHARDLLVTELELDDDEVYVVRSLFGLCDLWALYALDRPDLKDPPWEPITQARLAGAADLFTVLRQGDVLVQHPYDSFGTSVEAFLAQAASDPWVLAIKHSLYRTSGSEDTIVRTLTRAAEAGKQVVTLVELTARFDEEANIEWARKLEQAGVHVVYGLVGLKTHAKVTLVVRREGGGIRTYCHFGTGNYNPETARSYEDLGLLTASPELGADLVELFNHLTGYSRHDRYRKLLVAPATLAPTLLQRIRDQIDTPDGRIVIKVNSLSDAGIIDALYEASRAGVEIDLIVRGICCLRPGVPGLSENIRVRSVVGRFLEHSRIYRFGGGADGARFWIGSADLLRRNLHRRVEVLAPVEDPTLRDRLEEILRICLEDDRLAWELGPDDRWRKVPVGRDVSTHLRLQESARQRAG